MSGIHDDSVREGRTAWVSIMEQRATFRFLADATVNCRVPASPRSATVSDVSTRGCRLSFDHGAVLPGNTILIELLPGFHAIGKVVWKKDNTAGIEFDTTLDESFLDHVRAGGT